MAWQPQTNLRGPKGDPGDTGPKGDKGDKGDPGGFPDAPADGKVYGRSDETWAETAAKTSVDGKVSKAGDTMTGPLTLAADPTASMQAATKQYVDSKVVSSGAVVSDAEPATPTLGMLWWKPSEQTLSVWTGSAWGTVVGTWA